MNSNMKKDPIVINEEILQDAMKKEVNQTEENMLNKLDYVFLREAFVSCMECRSELFHLRLENKNILKIDLLYDFTSLMRLDLNNNVIEKIEGLESLINLTWLNLSFNKIKKIQGLDTLQKLEVLNLSHNQISVVENMDTLEDLRLLFIGNNLIRELDTVLYLKRFRNLFKLYMAGNPVSNEENYTLFIIAFLPNLTCLDSILIDSEIREEASVKNRCLLDKMKLQELQKQRADEAQQSQEAELKLHRDAFVEDLSGSSLFNSMFKDDPEAVGPQLLPGVAPLLQTLEDQTGELCRAFVDFGLAEHKQRETELNSFFVGQDEAEAYYRQKASQKLAEFDQEHKGRIAELQNLTESNLLKDKINGCNDAIMQLCESLLTVEFELVGNLEENITKLDNSMSDMATSFMETAQETFNQLRDLEDKYYQKVKEIVIETQEKVANQSLAEDTPDDVMRLFTDKDSLMNTLNNSHENHQQRINDREIQLVTQVSAWKVALFKEIQEKDVQRTHMRTSDIYRYADYLRKQLEN